MQRISAKQFVVFFASVIGLFVFYHFIVWSFFASKIFDASPRYVGDLGRMSYQIDSLAPRIPSADLPRKHLEQISSDQTVELVTIGDSFSNGMASGKNAYYQDYLATRLGINVLNIQNIDENHGYIDTVRYLQRTGWFKRHGTKAVLLQCVVRESLNHVPSKNIPLSPPKDLNAALFDKKFTTEFPTPQWINTGNYKFPYYAIAYRFNNHAKKEVYRFPLTRNMFSSKTADNLLVYHDDLNNLSRFNEKSIRTLNDQLNALSHELSREDITLLFMPSADKYDLYYDFISERNEYPENPFFDLLRKQPKTYRLVDTKAILMPLLVRNIRDVYYPDDTHWSYKASDAISQSPVFDFLEKGNR